MLLILLTDVRAIYKTAKYLGGFLFISNPIVRKMSIHIKIAF